MSVYLRWLYNIEQLHHVNVSMALFVVAGNCSMFVLGTQTHTFNQLQKERVENERKYCWRSDRMVLMRPFGHTHINNINTWQLFTRKSNLLRKQRRQAAFSNSIRRRTLFVRRLGSGRKAIDWMQQYCRVSNDKLNTYGDVRTPLQCHTSMTHRMRTKKKHMRWGLLRNATRYKFQSLLCMTFIDSCPSQQHFSSPR